jgi:predicted Rossmann-fold nucleotide-binding protein
MMIGGGLFCLMMNSVQSKTSTLCTSQTSNASYTGFYKGAENYLTSNDYLKDYICAERFIKKYPLKFVTIFGSSRIKANNHSGKEKIDEANNKLYQKIYHFAFQWTKNYGKKYPILSGAGPGIMEAAARGAMNAGGPSIGYTTYYGPSRNNLSKKKGLFENKGDASLAFWKYHPSKKSSQSIISDGLIFSSVAVRESMMILHSTAMIFAPGGTGTEWELFQTIEQIKSAQLTPIPIYLIGDKKIHWKYFYLRLESMIQRGTIHRHEVESMITHINDPKVLIQRLSKDLHLK